MQKKSTKIISKIIVLAIVLTTFAFPNYAYAVDCSGITIQTDIENLQGGAAAPRIDQIVCPAIRLVNVLTGLAMAGFALMIFMGAYKYAVAQGDPKALDGAKGTLTFALFGFLIVLGIFVLLKILQGVFGINSSLLLNPFGKLQEGISELCEFAERPGCR